MEAIYPPGPATVPADLTRPTAAYRRQAWLAVGVLLLFIVLYFLLAGWFALTAYRLLGAAFRGTGNTMPVWLTGLCSGFLALFMLKALVFIKHGAQSQDVEIKPEQQPGLFAFLNRLADEAGAPRPHRVFLSPDVNAAVFYDLSLLNLLFPSKKNLVIGVGLVNVLSLGEFKAVLAHEFGHFAQRSMAVGRWVYVAQQIAGHIIAKRDALDAFLATLASVDFRIAWIAWTLQLILWSIRSLVETLFRGVIVVQRALSREMEMQADLVAVSLTGSDALVHALHRLQAADDAWARAVDFGRGELAGKRAVQDLFAVQRRIIEHIAAIRNDANYGTTPFIPAEQPARHRVFQADLAQPPRMWSTHPLNHEREDNAKRTYIPAAVDPRSAWDLFAGPQQVREQITARVLGKHEAAPVSTADALPALDKQFAREAYKREYRGVYLGRSVVRAAARPEDLYGASPHAVAAHDLDTLYPASLQHDLEQLRALEGDKAMLEALHNGLLQAAGGVIRCRGNTIDRHALPTAIATLDAERAAMEQRISDHDRLCRTLHRAAAAQLGNGWEPHLTALAHLLHYAEHRAADLADAWGAAANVVHVVTAIRRIGDAGVQRVVAAMAGVHKVLAGIYAQAGDVAVNDELATLLGAATWKDSLGEFKLPEPTKANINEWIKVADGWVNSTLGALSALRQGALEQLLKSEAWIARSIRESGTIEAAPPPVQAPAAYAALLPGGERKRQTRLGWRARFENAVGIGPTLARGAVALGIIGTVLGVSANIGVSHIHIYNGFERPLEVSIGEQRVRIGGLRTDTVEVKPGKPLHIAAITDDGKTIESFDVTTDTGISRHVYNIAGAAPLVEWTAIYSHAGDAGTTAPPPDRPRGAPRWSSTTADFVLEQPPTTVSGNRNSREVLSAAVGQPPQAQLGLVQDPAQAAALIRSHARWEPAHARQLQAWLALALQMKGGGAIVAARLNDNPGDIVTLRLEQDFAAASDPTGKAHAAVCERQRAAAQAAPANGDLHYLAIRCLDDRAPRDREFLAGHKRWPQSAWFAFAAGYTQAEVEHWREAEDSFAAASRDAAAAQLVALDMARVRRIAAAGPEPVELGDLAGRSSLLKTLLSIEAGSEIKNGPLLGYVRLAQGRIDGRPQSNAGLKDAMKDYIASPSGNGRATAAPMPMPMPVAPDIDSDPRLLRLTAASDGAPAALMPRALALPLDKGMDAESLAAALGLVLRAKGDAAPYLALLPQYFPADDAAALARFAAALRSGADADRALGAVMPETRGCAYVVGVVALGRAAPAAWRQKVRKLLFAAERPYFS